MTKVFNVTVKFIESLIKSGKPLTLGTLYDKWDVYIKKVVRHYRLLASAALKLKDGSSTR